MKHGTLSDTNLASRLDTVFGMDRQQPVYDCYRLVCKKYGLEPSSYRMDSTDVPFYGTGYGDLGDGGTLPEYGGNSKNRRNDLLRRTSRPYATGTEWSWFPVPSTETFPTLK